MAFDLNDEELKATRQLFRTLPDEEVLRNIIAEYDARVEDCKTYDVTVPISRKETIAIDNILRENQRLKEKQDRLAFKTNSIMNEVITNNIVSKDVIREEIKKLKDMNVEGEVFTTAVNFAIKNLEELLNK